MAVKATGASRSRRRSKTLLRWYLIISLVVLFLAAVLGLQGGLINFLERHANILDNQYVPVDLDRRTEDKIQKVMKDLDVEKLKELQRKYEQRLKSGKP